MPAKEVENVAEEVSGEVKEGTRSKVEDEAKTRKRKVKKDLKHVVETLPTIEIENAVENINGGNYEVKEGSLPNDDDKSKTQKCKVNKLLKHVVDALPAIEIKEIAVEKITGDEQQGI